jgi:hypothetical protein
MEESKSGVRKSRSWAIETYALFLPNLNDSIDTIECHHEGYRLYLFYEISLSPKFDPCFYLFQMSNQMTATVLERYCM